MTEKRGLMAVSKADNAKRLRYIRILERFSQSIITYLFKSDTLSKEVYDKKVDSNIRYLERTEAVPLYKSDYSDLEALIHKMIAYRNGESDMEEIKTELLYQANQIEKSMNRRRYKKDKHGSDMFKDWE